MNVANGADKLIDGKQNVYNIALPKHFFAQNRYILYFSFVFMYLLHLIMRPT